MKSILAASICFLSLAAATAHGQHSLAMHTHVGAGSYSACVDGRFNAPIALYPPAEVGDLDHQPLSTQSEEARRYFNQGLTFFYGFDSESAMRSFHQASKKDPDLAMAYWGVALAAGGDVNIPPDHPCLQLAVAQLETAYRKPAQDSERLYIQALAKLYSAGVAPEQRRKNYASAMELVYQQLGSKDPDAGALYAYSEMNIHPWEWWTPSGRPSDEIQRALRALEAKLPIPPHIGLNHFYIHAMEEAPIAEAAKAKASADFLHAKAPSITPHLHHMPAHIYLLLGDWNGVRRANQQAVQLDTPWADACKEYISNPECKKCTDCKKCPGFKECSNCEKCNPLLVGHYYSHDLLFWAVGYNNYGQWDAVQALSRQLEDNVRKFIDGQPGLEHYLTTQVMMMVHFGKWQMLTQLDPPQTNMPSFESPSYCADLRYKLAAAMWYFGRAMGNASLGNPTDSYVQGFQKARDCVKSAGLGWGNNSASDILQVVHWRMSERIERKKALKLSQTLALNAVEAEDLLNYDEPPGWYLSSRETYGALLFLNGHYGEAEQVFRKDLARRPNNSRSLFGLWQALDKQGSPEAEKAKKDFTGQWMGGQALPKMEDL